MAFAAEQLSRIGQTIGDNGQTYSLFFHVTTAALATVQAAGYFNLARDKVKVGELVLASVGVGGTAATAIVRFVTVPASGNITTATVLTTA